jgi:hypothetical protein
MMRFERLCKDSEYESLILKGKWNEWNIYSADRSGDVEISVDGDDGSKCVSLSQDELKVLVEFLQKQIK